MNKVINITVIGLEYVGFPCFVFSLYTLASIEFGKDKARVSPCLKEEVDYRKCKKVG